MKITGPHLTSPKLSKGTENTEASIPVEETVEKPLGFSTSKKLGSARTILFLSLFALVKPSFSQDGKGIEKPASIQQAIELEKSNPKIFDNYINGLLDNTPGSNGTLISNLPMETKRRTIKRLYEETAKKYKENSPDVAKFEDRPSWYLYIVPKAELKEILAHSKEEQQDFIEAYLNTATNPKLQRGKDYDKTYFNFPYIIPSNKRLSGVDGNLYPAKLFNPQWYQKINELIGSLKNDSTFKRSSGSGKTNEEVMEVLNILAVIESANNSGIKERKIFNELLKAADNDQALGIKLILPSLINNYVLEEAKVNSILGNKRYYWGNGTTWEITHDETIIKPIEERINKVLVNPPAANASEEAKATYNKAMEMAGTLRNTPYYRNNCSILWLNTQLDPMSKAPLENIPKLIDTFKENSCKLTPYYSYNTQIYRDSYIGGKEHFKIILKRACESLLSPNQAENTKALAIINSLNDSYYDQRPLPPLFRQDNEINNLFSETIQKVKDKRVSLLFFRLTQNKNIENNIFNSLNSSIDNLPKQAVSEHELNLLNYSSEFIQQITPKYRNEDFSKNIDLLYRNLSEKIISNSSDPTTLNAAWELFLKSSDFSETHKGSKELMESVVVSKLFSSILDASNNLADSDKDSFKNNIYSNIHNFFHVPGSNNIRNQNVLSKTIDIIAEKSFSSKNNNNALDEISRLSNMNTIEPTQFYSNFYRAISYNILSHSPNQLSQQIEQVTDGFSSAKSKERISTIYALTNHHTALQKLSSNLSTPCIPLNYFITNEKHTKANNTLKVNNTQINRALLTHLSNVNVDIKLLSSNFNNIIDPEEFNSEIIALQTINKNADRNFAKTVLQIVEDRLSNPRERNPHNRGMLYKTLASLPSGIQNKDGVTVIDILKKGIVKEESPITARYIGKALGEITLDKLFENIPPLPEYSYRNTTDNSPIINNIVEKMGAVNKEINLSRVRSLHNKELPNTLQLIGSLTMDATAMQNGSPPVLSGVNEDIKYKQDPRYLLSCITRIACGYDGLDRPLIELGYSNFRDENEIIVANNKEGEKVNVTEDINRIRINAKAALLGFGQYLKEKSASNEVAKIINDHDPTGRIENEFRQVFRDITNAFDLSTNRSTLGNLHYHTTAILELNRFNEKADLDQKIQERIFNGKTDFSILESYERVLLGNLSYEYLRKDANFYNTPLGSIWDYIGGTKHTNGIITDNEGLSSKAKYERFKARRDKLHDELRKLNDDLYLKEVRRPLLKVKENFVEQFLKDVPNRRMGEYIEVLRVAGLLRDLGEIRMRLTLNGVERDYEMWSANNR